MPRLPRIQLDGAIFLITCRGQDGEMIFKDKADTSMYLELVNRYKEQHGFRLYAYSLLPERLHLLIEPGVNATISQVMHDLNSSYTKFFNAKNSRRGHLFESRFKSSLVEKTKYLADATRHIHREEPASSAVSSFDVYVMQDEKGAAASSAVSMQAEIQEVLSFLKNRNNEQLYKRYVLEPSGQDAAELEKMFRRSSVIGTPEFAERVQNRIQEYAELRKEEKSASPAKFNRVVIFILGALILLAVGNSIYLYVSRQKMEAQYEDLIRQMETQTSTGLLTDGPMPAAPSKEEGGL